MLVRAGQCEVAIEKINVCLLGSSSGTRQGNFAVRGISQVVGFMVEYSHDPLVERTHVQ